MPRVKLTEQSDYEFTYAMTLQPRDINYGGHLGNDSIVSLANIARVNMLRSVGFDENDLGDGKTGIIMSDLVVNYKAEGFLFDEFTIDTHVGEIKSSSFRVFHRIYRLDTRVALVETGMVTFDYASHKVGEMPDTFIKALIKTRKNISQGG